MLLEVGFKDLTSRDRRAACLIGFLVEALYRLVVYEKTWLSDR